jgi:hypothetical protein
MTEQGYKTCPKCGCTSLEVEFYNSNVPYCRSCGSSYFKILYHLKKSHPYPVDHRCDICGKSEDELPVSFGGMGRGNIGKLQKKTPWRLDHCHENGDFRGFLCANCNTGLGKFKDDPEILLNAIAYLQGHKEKAAL